MADVTLALGRSELAEEGLLGKKVVALPAFEVPPGLREDVRAVARDGWAARARSEYVGVMAVRKLHGLLVDLGAPLDLQELTLRMMWEEQRHTSLCMGAARALGAAPEQTFELTALQQARSARPLPEQLMQLIAGTYAVGEVVAFALLRQALAATPPSGFREVLRQIAADEALHARFGLAVLAHVRRDPGWLPYPGDEWLRAYVTGFVEHMAARRVVDESEVALAEDPEAAAQLAALGLPRPQETKAAYFEALEVDVPRGFAELGLADTPRRTDP